MINKLKCLLAMILLSIFSCDLNDLEPGGDFGLFLRAKIGGVNWAASSVGATLDKNGISPLVIIHGDSSNGNDHFYIKFPPIKARDTTIVSSGMVGIMEFHRNSKKWISGKGILIIHEAGTVTKHQYSGNFSGTFYNANDSLTITVGGYLAQGIF